MNVVPRTEPLERTTMQELSYTKTCTKCKEPKELLLFSKCSEKSDGLQIYCKKCQAGFNKKWRDADLEGHRLRSRNNRLNNPEKMSLYAKKSYAKHHERRRLAGSQADAKRRNHATADITEKELIELTRTHSIFCDMEGCEKPWKHLDHCHETGAIRGLLCNMHNVGLGHFHDSINELEAAVRYLINSRLRKV
jgi:hypothetical protein